MEKRDEFEERSTAFHSTIPFNSIEEAEKNKRKKKKELKNGKRSRGEGISMA